MREVRVIGQNGEQVGVVAIGKALILAQNAGLDLVEVAPEARPPVCKLMDFGKYKYEAAQKARDARRNQASTQLKEIRMGLKIDQHDYEVKLGHIRRFLDGGDKVKIMVRFRGREQSRPEMGMKLMERMIEDIAEDGTVESAPRQDGRNMIMVIAPVKRKTDAVSVQRKRREDERQAKRDAKAERALRNQKRVLEQSNAPMLKPLTFAQLGSGKLSATVNDSRTEILEKPEGGQGVVESGSKEVSAKPVTPKSASLKKSAHKTTTKATGEASSKSTRGVTRKTAPKSEKSTVGKTDKPRAQKAKAETEEK